jgi:hypothetical protein
MGFVLYKFRDRLCPLDTSSERTPRKKLQSSTSEYGFTAHDLDLIPVFKCFHLESPPLPSRHSPLLSPNTALSTSVEQDHFCPVGVSGKSGPGVIRAFERRVTLPAPLFQFLKQFALAVLVPQRILVQLPF